MQSKHIPGLRPSWRMAGIAGCFAVLLSACASVPPPTAQLAVANAAIDNAVSAGAPEFAPVELSSARNKMDLAASAMHREDHVLARQLAEEAQADARLAEKIAQSAKARKAAGVTQDDARVLREEINRKSN